MRNRILSSLMFFVLGCVVGAFVGYTLKAKHTFTDNPQETNITTDYQGIDVSNHQGKIDWSLVSQDENIKFVYMKATEGATYTDKSYARNISEARKNGLKVGSYHYLRNTSSIHAQFKNFTKVANKNIQDLIPMVDVEDSISKDSILLFCNLLEKHYGKKPAIYGTNRSYNSFCAPNFNTYILMIGRYGENRPIITGEGHYSIWQYSEKGIIKGIEKPVDLDKIHPDFDLTELNLY